MPNLEVPGRIEAEGIAVKEGGVLAGEEWFGEHVRPLQLLQEMI